MWFSGVVAVGADGRRWLAGSGGQAVAAGRMGQLG
jgi:hypothetical protein